MATSMSRLADISTLSISVARIIVGGSTLLLPLYTTSVLGIPLTPPATIVVRLFGMRELMLGILVWQARHRFMRNMPTGNALSIEEGKRDLRRLLWIGLIVDAVDVGSCVISELDGNIVGKAVVWVGGGAAWGVMCAVFGLRGLK